MYLYVHYPSDILGGVVLGILVGKLAYDFGIKVGRKKRRKCSSMIRNIINGFCMALADSVPGVSGGTVAFIMGFMKFQLDALNNLFSQ